MTNATINLSSGAIISKSDSPTRTKIIYAQWNPSIVPEDSGWQFLRSDAGEPSVASGEIWLLAEVIEYQTDIYALLDQVDYDSDAEASFERDDRGIWRRLSDG